MQRFVFYLCCGLMIVPLVLANLGLAVVIMNGHPPHQVTEGLMGVNVVAGFLFWYLWKNWKGKTK